MLQATQTGKWSSQRSLKMRPAPLGSFNYISESSVLFPPLLIKLLHPQSSSEGQVVCASPKQQWKGEGNQDAKRQPLFFIITHREFSCKGVDTWGHAVPCCTGPAYTPATTLIMVSVSNPPPAYPSSSPASYTPPVN